MMGSRLTLLVGATVFVWGCSGRLTFDPRAQQQDGAAQPPSSVTTPDARAAEEVGVAPAPLPQKPDGGMGVPDTTPYPPPPDAMAPPQDTMTAPADTMPAPPLADAMPAAAACPPGTDVAQIFKTSCGQCHGSSSPANNLDLVSPGLALRLLNKTAQCTNRPLLSTTGGSAPAGVLLEKLAGPVSDCGVQMPPTGIPALSATDMACVTEWAADAINKAAGR
jgi:mono/diheme cytochrome c family protein